MERYKQCVIMYRPRTRCRVFALEADPRWVGGTEIVSFLGVSVASLAAGMAAGKVGRGCVAGLLTGALLIPLRGFISNLLIALSVGPMFLVWGFLSALMTGFSGFLSPLWIALTAVGAITGGIAGYLSARMARWMARRRRRHHRAYPAYAPLDGIDNKLACRPVSRICICRLRRPSGL